jgi:predicted porin
MKKHLIAAAVAGALAVPAMAQVTVYGIIETGIETTSVKNTTTGDGTTGSDSVFNSSRLGFKGEEDLGGGLKASFRLETSLQINAVGDGNGNGVGSSTKGFWDRGAEVNVSGGFGTVRLGKFDHQGAENTDLNNIGNIALFDGVEFGSDQASTVGYVSPSFAGNKIHISKTAKDSGTDTDITSYAAEGKVGMVSYRVGAGDRKLTAGGKDKVMGGALLADFGMASASVAYQKFDANAATSDRKMTVIGVTVPLGSGLAVGLVNRNYDHVTSTSDWKENAFFARKALSKRTSVYGMYRTRDVKATTNQDTTETYVGVLHSF